MGAVSPESVRTEIEKELGRVPTVFEPAAGDPRLLENLWSGLRDFYLRNPLPDRLKDLLFADLSHACGNPFCVAILGCDLLARGRSPESLIEFHEQIAAGRLNEGEARLVSLSREFFLRQGGSGPAADGIRDLLGDAFPAWVALMGTIAFCHRWVEGFLGAAVPAETPGAARLSPEAVRSRINQWREITRFRRRAPAAPPAARPVVLAVDDHPEIRDFLKVLLEGAGYAVRSAPDGLRAVEAVRAGGVDLVVMDVHMPVLGGVEALRRMREAAPRLPVLLMSGDIDSDAERAAATGLAQALFAKPFDIGKMLEKVREHLPLPRPA